MAKRIKVQFGEKEVGVMLYEDSWENGFDARGDAVNRAVKKLYGSKAEWFPDSGVRGFGQVMKESRYGGYDAVTYMIRGGIIEA